MATVRHQIRVARPADAVWAVVGDAGAIHRWFPGIVAASVGEDDDGAFRDVELASGLTMRERIVTDDALLRRFQYRIDTPVFREHLGTVDVIDLGDGTSMVVYGTDAVPAPLALVIGGASSVALEQLARLLEGDEVH